MRFEGAGIYWMVGFILIAAVWTNTRFLSYAARRWIRSLSMSWGLGFGLVVTHDAIVITPSTQMLVHGLMGIPQWNEHLTLGFVFFFINWLCSYFALGLWKPTDLGPTEIQPLLP